MNKIKIAEGKRHEVMRNVIKQIFPEVIEQAWHGLELNNILMQSTIGYYANQPRSGIKLSFADKSQNYKRIWKMVWADANKEIDADVILAKFNELRELKIKADALYTRQLETLQTEQDAIAKLCSKGHLDAQDRLTLKADGTYRLQLDALSGEEVVKIGLTAFELRKDHLKG